MQKIVVVLIVGGVIALLVARVVAFLRPGGSCSGGCSCQGKSYRKKMD
jgi:hypothetical protein